MSSELIDLTSSTDGASAEAEVSEEECGAATPAAGRSRQHESSGEVQFVRATSGAGTRQPRQEEKEVAFVREVKRGAQRQHLSEPPDGGYKIAAAPIVDTYDVDDDLFARKRRRSRPFKCSICLEDVEGWRGHPLQRCGHKFCVPCLAKWIKSSSSTAAAGAGGRTACPHPDCQDALEIGDVRSVFRDDPDEWRTYADGASAALLEREISVGGSTRRCPAERCNYVFVYEPGGDGDNEGQIFVCPLCDAAFCLDCGANGGRVGPAHDGTCSQRLQQLEKEAEERRKLEQWKTENSQADDRFRELIQRESQNRRTLPCPKCKRLVTKNGGCDHMRCVCGHNYNWSSVE